MKKEIKNQKGRVAYFENLDGLRFLSFLSVFFFHSFHTDYSQLRDTRIYQFIKFDVFGNGNLGVNFFFVLSGFLITYLLISEKKFTGKIHLGNFWMRRILRIWPLFYFSVLFGFFVFPVLKLLFGQTPNETADILYYISFLNNFDFIEKGPPDASILGVLWSIAVEEQFYFIWPLILFLIPLQRLWIGFLAILILSICFRGYYDSRELNEYHTLSCIGDMVIGASGAWLVFFSERFKIMIGNLNRPLTFLIYTAFFVMYFFRQELLMTNYYLRIFERPLIAIIILCILLEQNYSRNSFFKIGKSKTISRLGVISYGLYCLHFIGILISTNLTKALGFNTELWQVIILETTVALSLTILMAWFSYRYYESPFLLWKRKFTKVAPSLFSQ